MFGWLLCRYKSIVILVVAQRKYRCDRYTIITFLNQILKRNNLFFFLLIAKAYIYIYNWHRVKEGSNHHLDCVIKEKKNVVIIKLRVYVLGVVVAYCLLPLLVCCCCWVLLLMLFLLLLFNFSKRIVHVYICTIT